MNRRSVIPLTIVALCAINAVLSFMDKDWSELFMTITAATGWVTVWEYRKYYS